jgi:hypothetical protein
MRSKIYCWTCNDWQLLSGQSHKRIAFQDAVGSCTTCKRVSVEQSNVCVKMEWHCKLTSTEHVTVWQRNNRWLQNGIQAVIDDGQSELDHCTDCRIIDKRDDQRNERCACSGRHHRNHLSCLPRDVQDLYIWVVCDVIKGPAVFNSLERVWNRVAYWLNRQGRWTQFPYWNLHVRNCRRNYLR